MDSTRTAAWRGRAAATLRERLVAVRLTAVIAAQAGVSAGVAWFLAAGVFGHHNPFFAPIAAVIVLVGATGRRLRRAFELVAGVAVGIAVADLLIAVIGVGPVQIGAVVVLAVLVAVFLGIGGVAIVQAASSAVLVATFAPPSGGIYYVRAVDAVIGGAVGIVVMTLLLPFNPLTRVGRAAGAALAVLRDALADVAAALDQRDPGGADRALERMRATESDHAALREALTASRETATLAPLRWPARRALLRYQAAAVHIERATRNARVLARRAATVVRDGEPVPDALVEAARGLSAGVATLRRELADARTPRTARGEILDAVGAAARAYRAGVGFSGGVVTAQIRSAAVDLLIATGLDPDVATREVRAAVAADPDPST